MKDLVETLGAWGLPSAFILIIISIFLIMQITGEIIEWTGRVSPKILKLRKLLKEHKMKKQKQHEQLEKLNEIASLMQRVENTLSNIDQHYNADNISQRDAWIREVNENINWTKSRAEVYDKSIVELSRLKEAADRLSEFNCKQIKEYYRNRILDFQHRIINSKNKKEPERFSHEEFAKIYATYKDYEDFLEYTNDENHQVDNAMETINKAERGELLECYNIEFTD